MQSLRQIGGGLLLGIFSIVTVVGAISLSLAEGKALPTLLPTATQTAIEVTFPPTNVPVVTLPLDTETPAASPTPTQTFTPPPPPTACPPPTGWVSYYIQPGDTLETLVTTFHINSVDELKNANCLVSNEIVPGTYLYVPPNPTATAIPCGPYPGWINYYVQPGDTLTQIGYRYRVSVTQLMLANCLTTTNIKVGQVLKVPNVPTLTPWPSATYPPTFTNTATLEPTSTDTGTPEPVTETPTSTNEVPTTEVPSPTTETPPTETPVPPTVATP